MPTCKHPKYTHKLKFMNVKMPELGTFQPTLLLTVVCNECGDPYVFRAPNGYSTIHPTTNTKATELRIPIDYPISEEADEGILQ